MSILVICIMAIFLVTESISAQDTSSEASGGIEMCGLSQSEIDDGWIALFDGKSTFGWKASSKANWEVKDGIIEVSQGPKGLLYTTSQFDDFELKAQFKIEAETNSGIFVRSSPKPRNPAGDCYEINLAGPKSAPFQAARW